MTTYPPAPPAAAATSEARISSPFMIIPFVSWLVWEIVFYSKSLLIRQRPSLKGANGLGFRLSPGRPLDT